MKNLEDIKKDTRLKIDLIGFDGGCGTIQCFKNYAMVIFSNGAGWDHVSMSFKHRVPTWEEMCILKSVFFEDDECVVQYHPPKIEYVNNHQFCLHLWKPINIELPKPPSILVGSKELNL